MKRLLIALCLVLTCATAVHATEYAALWSVWSLDGQAIYLTGFHQGLTFMPDPVLTTLKESGVAGKNAYARIVIRAYEDRDTQGDMARLARIMSALYADPANAHIHPGVLFFAASAQLAGYPDSEIVEALRIMR